MKERHSVAEMKCRRMSKVEMELMKLKLGVSVSLASKSCAVDLSNC